MCYVFFTIQGLTIDQKESLSVCNEQLGFRKGVLFDMLEYINGILRDDSFIREVLAINQDIFNLGQAEEWQSTKP